MDSILGDTAFLTGTDFTYAHLLYHCIYKILFCKRALWKRRYSAKETYNFKEPYIYKTLVFVVRIRIRLFVFILYIHTRTRIHCMYTKLVLVLSVCVKDWYIHRSGRIYCMYTMRIHYMYTIRIGVLVFIVRTENEYWYSWCV